MLKVSQWFGVIIIVFACGIALPVAGQTRDALESAFYLEDSLLEQESERYARAREKDRQAMQRLMELAEQMEQALFDENVSVSELRSLEGELNVARETAMERLRASSELRTNIYRNLDRLDHLGHEIELLEDRSLIQLDSLDGVWEIEAYTPFAGTFGLMKLSMSGTAIQGTYRLSNGHQGSLRGTLVGKVVKLTRSDSEFGDDMQIEGIFDSEGGEITGTWKSKVFGAGRPELGDWTARKISSDEARDMTEELVNN